MRQDYSNFNDFISSRYGLENLHAIYGNTCLPLVTCVNDMRKRVFWIGGKLVIAKDDDMLQTLREMAYAENEPHIPRPLDLSKYTYDEDGTLPASAHEEEREPYAIVEEPCGAGFRYVGLATREEYEEYKRQNPCCYG